MKIVNLTFEIGVEMQKLEEGQSDMFLKRDRVVDPPNCVNYLH